jgi:hypothetical protein
LASLAVPSSESATAGQRAPRVGGDTRAAWWRWLAALVVFLALGLALALAGHARPAYDANGWLVWGHQILHGTLNLDGAPSWKPLTFLFTLPYALTGHQAEMWCWIVTACAGGVAGPLLAGRVAYRLSPLGQGWMPARLPPLVAALVAGLATATMTVAAKSSPTDMGLLRQVLIATSDPLILALWLAAVDAHLSRRHGWALGLLWLSALGRPEAWIFLAGYGLWLWLTTPRVRVWVVLAILSMPVAWFLAPGLASHSLFSAGDLDLGQPTAIPGNKVVGVLNRVRTLSGTAVQIEVAAAIVLCALRRDRAALGLAALALVWTLVEIAFALHGWSAVQRYMIEAGGLLAVVGGVGAAHALALGGAKRGPVGAALTVAGVVGVLGFGVVAEPFVNASVNATRAVVANQKLNAAQLRNLNRLIARSGGASHVLACGAPAVTLGWQSGLAWQLGLNVASVGYGAGPLHSGRPVVEFRTTQTSWSIKLLNTPASLTSSCAGLNGLSS